MSLEFINGATLLCRAALDSGCEFFAGYPISPATAIHLNLMREMPLMGRTAIQGEDEIASISMCIAASMAGKKTMTATSGPGISLYSESIGLAVMGEVPLVIVDVQRLGPATGGATTGAQGDILFVRNVTSGGIPIPVLCPSSAESVYRLTAEAFNISEKLRTPVFLLTSKDMMLSRFTVDTGSLAAPESVTRNYYEEDGPFTPYSFDRRIDIPDFLPVGGEKCVRFTTSMHDKQGYLTKDPAEIERKILHLKEKIDHGMKGYSFLQYEGDKTAEILVLTYGINTGVAKDLVRRLRSMGKNSSLVVIETLFPLPEKELKEILSGADTIILPELNTGLYADAIAHLIPENTEFKRVNRLDGDLFTTDYILQRIGGI